MAEFGSETGRSKTSELVADRQGRAFDTGAPGHRSAMEPRTDPQRHEHAEFARQIAGELHEAALADRFDALVVVAAPKTLGDLRISLTPQAQARVTIELDKDLTGLTRAELEEHLGAELWG